MDITLTQQENASNNAIYHAKLALTPIHLPARLASQDQFSNLTPASSKLLAILTAAAPIADKETTMCL